METIPDRLGKEEGALLEKTPTGRESQENRQASSAEQEKGFHHRGTEYTEG
jgi:hypothetical protein